MQKTLIAAALASALAVPAFTAQAEEPASPHTLSANVSLTSQYIFRGLSQSNEDPALQGGFDYSHASGLYIGTWASSITWLKDSGVYDSSSLELDLYGGYRGNITEDVSFDVGVLQYYYPGEKVGGAVSPNTTEIYGAVGWKWLSAKYSYALTDAFGIDDGSGSWYLEVGADFPLTEALTLNLHYGKQEFDGSVGGVSNDQFSYDDWKVGLAYELPQGFTVGAYYTDTDAKRSLWTINSKYIGDSQMVVFVSKTF
jgi:uncharacterized protein (TIGR02001 family)